MPPVPPPPDAREVIDVDALVTVRESERADAFLELCTPGSSWQTRIRTADVVAVVVTRAPLGTFDERSCTCLRLRLDRPVPVEPGLRFTLEATDGSGLAAVALVRPWTQPPACTS